jgi:AcrR family transcriptional regulator
MELFARDGFAQTTVEQIAASMGVSGRTVFRYFTSKEDMVIGHLDDIGQRIADALSTRPKDEPVWAALRHAMQPHLDELTRNAEANLGLAAMLAQTPALQPALLSKRARWADALIPHVLERLTGPSDTREPRARAIATCALACLNVTVDEWARTDGTTPLDALLDTTLAAVHD